MSRDGTNIGGLLRQLHADGCPGDNVRMDCEPVTRQDPNGPDEFIDVVAMEWCEDCGAADWEVA